MGNEGVLGAFSFIKYTTEQHSTVTVLIMFGYIHLLIHFKLMSQKLMLWLIDTEHSVLAMNSGDML